MEIYSQTANGTLYQGDCLEVLSLLPSDSIDTMVTDPPYGLSFMGKKWDYEVPGVNVWKQCLRVLKPGATALIFAGSRTQHRMAVNVEDAGFILKDTIMWIYGSGFPKSTDISKQIDKTAGNIGVNVLKIKTEIKQRYVDKRLTLKEFNSQCGFEASGYLRISSTWATILPSFEKWIKIKNVLSCDNELDNVFRRAQREVIGKSYTGGADAWINGMNNKEDGGDRYTGVKGHDITSPATNEAKTWNGWGTALKPAYEPILVCQKPNDGTYVQNALKHGVAGLNIDGGRVDLQGEKVPTGSGKVSSNTNADIMSRAKGKPDKNITSGKGRFPANIILDEEAGRLLDEQSGILKSGGTKGKKYKQSKLGMYTPGINQGTEFAGSQGYASRFFYCTKSSKSERNQGCEELEEKLCGMMEDDNYPIKTGSGNIRETKRRNHHPTVKPLALMKYLVKLTATPTGGTVFDPFAGSGTTGGSLYP